jgi:glycogen debranching enzyme
MQALIANGKPARNNPRSFGAVLLYVGASLFALEAWVAAYPEPGLSSFSYGLFGIDAFIGLTGLLLWCGRLNLRQTI